jgi:hypothetical protein
MKTQRWGWVVVWVGLWGCGSGKTFDPVEGTACKPGAADRCFGRDVLVCTCDGDPSQAAPTDGSCPSGKGTWRVNGACQCILPGVVNCQHP